ncbi:MAG: CRISPR-associated protein Cas4 [Peptococcaceae bacterium]
MVWYYYICPREVWLIGHQITPDQDDANVSLGRFIQEYSYTREKKELMVGHSKMDVFHISDGELVIGEVKKSSRYRQSARMQLAFYLSELQQRGIKARGELRFPKEKKREEVVLDEQTEAGLDRTRREILRILYLPQPPLPVKNRYCKKCAYAEFCWA